MTVPLLWVPLLWVPLLWVPLLLWGCRDGGAEATAPAPGRPGPSDAARSQESLARPSASRDPSPEASTPEAANPKVSEAEPEGDEPEPRPSSFPPKNFEPPFERSAQEGDGVWAPLGGAAEPAMVRTTVHPHEASRFLTVHVVALDLRRLALHYMPGADDVGNVVLPAPLEPGRIPREHLSGLTAAFNGGFMPQHGRWGMKAAGAVVVPPRETGCTVALLEPAEPSGADAKGASAREDGITAGNEVVIVPWPKVEGRESRATFYRQTPPCLLDEGQLHPSLSKGNEKPWGGFNPNLVTRRRSAVGLDETGEILFYAVGIEVGPRLLAEGLRHVGATQAAELDINDNWTRFALFEVDETVGEPRVATMLLDDMVRQKSGYVARPSKRDFFYLRRPR